MKELFGGSCYGYCLAYLFGDVGSVSSIKYLTSCFLEGWRRGWVDDDGYVSSPLAYIQLICGTKYRDIEKVTLKSFKELPNGKWIVEMECPSGGSHFVVTNNKGELLFDPSGVSNSWKNGKFISYRKFIQ